MADENDSGAYVAFDVEELDRQETCRAFATEQLLCDQAEGGQRLEAGGDDQHLIEFTKMLQRLCRSLRTSGLPMHYDRKLRRPGEIRVRATRLGLLALDACQYYASQPLSGRSWEDVRAEFLFHPEVDVAWKAVSAWSHAVVPPGWTMEEVRSGRAPGVMEGLEALARDIRQATLTAEFRHQLHDQEEKARANFRSASRYLISMFRRFSRLLVLRVDLYIRPGHRSWSYGRGPKRAVINYLRALRDGGIVPGFRGFLVKMEGGIRRGAHFHLMVLLDGHLHQSAWFLTQALGEAWMKRLGSDRSSFFNCYANKDKYAYNGLGLVHVADVNRLVGLRVALWYLTKQDCVLVLGEKKARYFWRSPITREPRKRGAPRKSDSDMGLVKRILGGPRSKYPPFPGPWDARTQNSNAGASSVGHGANAWQE